MTNAAVDQLGTMRLIKGEWKGTNVRWYELAHDRFIEPIRRSNEKWMAGQSRGEQIRLRLEAKASKWQPGSDLLEADELIEARRLIKAGVASKSLMALVDASRASSQRKRIRSLKLLGVAAAVIAILFLGIALFAWIQWGIARSQLLASKASMLLEVDPELSVLLAQEARVQFADTEAAREVIRQGLTSLSNVAGALPEQSDRVKNAVFGRDGQYILTTSVDGTAGLWDTKTKKKLKQFGGKQDEVIDAAFSPDGNLIVTTGADGKARLWDGATGAPVRELQGGHIGRVNAAVFSPNSELVATAGDDQTAIVWNVGTGEKIKVLSGHQGSVHEIVFSPDGTRIATEATDETGRIWEWRTSKVLVLPGLTGQVAAMAFSPDGKVLVTEGGPGTERGVGVGGNCPATVWSVDSGRAKATLAGHEQYIAAVAFSPDGSLIVTSSGDNTARVWDQRGSLISELRGHTRSVSDAVFSSDGTRIVTASADNTARVWDVYSGRSLTELRGHSLPLNTAAFSPDGQFILTAGDDRAVRLWSVSERGGVVVLRGHSNSVNSAAYSPDGRYILTAGIDGRLWITGAGEPAPLGLLKRGRSGEIIDARFSPDGKWIATASSDMQVQIWNVDSISGITKQSEKDLNTDDLVNSVAFSPDSKSIIAACRDGTVRVWNHNTGELVDLPKQIGSVNSAAFSSDGKFILTAGADGARIWDATGHKLLSRVGPDQTEVQWAQYGLMAVDCYGGNNIGRVWKAADGSMLAELRGHHDRINRAWFSADSKLIVTSSTDKTARVWNASTGQGIAILRGHTGSVLDAVFSPDGELVLTASEDYTARAYPHGAFVPFEQLEGLIKERIVRVLTSEERRDYLDEP